jgi:hypothetical protein
LWKVIDGEPYMINPHLGVISAQMLNPKGKRRSMASKSSRRHMAWVRSFRKKNRSRRRKHNPYPLAGAVVPLANYRKRRHRKHNPHRKHRRKHNPGLRQIARGTFGLPPLMPVVYGAGGFIGTAMVQGFVDTLVPAGYNASTSMVAKYAEIAASIVIVTWVAKKFISPGAAAFAAVGGGIFAMQQAAHDFASGLIPGMHAYTPLKAYTPIRPGSTMGGFRGMRAVIESAGGGFPQLATRDGMPQLAFRAPDQGFKDSARYAADGAMNVVSERFRRF